jgi:hypothetical protein
VTTSAEKDPTGSRLMNRIPATVRMNLMRASARWKALSPST